MGGAVGHERQVELALDQPALAVLEGVDVDRLAVQRDVPAAHHRVGRGRGDPVLGEERRERLALLGLDADDESIRRVRRRLGAPGVEEVAAREREEQDRGEAEAERDDLHGVRPGAAPQGGEAVAPAQPGERRERRGGAQRAEADDREDEEPRAEPAEHDQPELRVAGLPDEERRDRGRADPVGGERALLRRADVAADHAQRRDVLELQQRRQGEAEQQRHPGEKALHRRQERRLRQRDDHQPGDEFGDHELREIAGDAAHGAGRGAERDELPREEARELPLRRAEAAHHRVAVEVPPGVAARRERHRHGREDHREQRGEADELLRALDPGADLGPRVREALHRFAAAEPRTDPRFEASDRLPLAGGEQVIPGPAPDLDELRLRHVGPVHHQARRDVEEVHAAVRLEREDGGDRQLGFAELDPVPDLRLQRGREPLVDPDGARGRHAFGARVGLVRRRRDAQVPAQRIAVGHRLHADELRLAAEARHADEGRVLGELQAAARDLVADLGPPRMVGGQHDVGAEQLVGLAQQRLPHAVGEERDAGDARHRDHERERENAQLAGPPVAAEHPQREGEVHGHTLLDSPAGEADRAPAAAGERLVVGHEDERRALLGVELEDEIDDAGAGRRVEVAGRLVGEEQLRAHDERARERDALLLAAGERARVVAAGARPGRRARASRAPCARRPGRRRARAAASRSRAR